MVAIASIGYYLVYIGIILFHKLNLFQEDYLMFFYDNMFRYGCVGLLLLFGKGLRPNLVNALVSWWFFAWAIYAVLKNKYRIHAFPLAYISCIFYSEFYEIPVYVNRYIWKNLVPLSSTNIPLVFIKLLVFVILYAELGKKTVQGILRFLIPFTVFGVMIVRTFGLYGLGAISPLILKFICLVHFIIITWE